LPIDDRSLDTNRHSFNPQIIQYCQSSIECRNRPIINRQ